MRRKTRREFLTDLGVSIGAVTLVRGIVNAGSSFGEDQKKIGILPRPISGKEIVDFRYAPRSWRSSFCFPEDPHKSLVGKNGELFYGYTGENEGIDSFTYIVAFGFSGGEPGTFVGQSLASPELPIITTTLGWKGLSATLTTFATKSDREGRVDNILVEILVPGTAAIPVAPEIIIRTDRQLTIENRTDSSSRRGQIGILTAEHEPDHPFLIVDSNITMRRDGDSIHLKLQENTVTASNKVNFFIRLPLGQQKVDDIKDGMKDAEKLLKSTRSEWESWRPSGEKVTWNLVDEYQHFIVAVSRNMVESADIKNQQPVFQIGPTRANEMKIIDTHFILESVRYLGFDEAAQSGLQALWNTQRDDGTFSSVVAGNNWKETAIAVYALIRHAELTQNWDFFDEMYPDAWKALMYLQEIQKKSWDDTTPNGKNGLLPAGYGGNGINGISSELTNTLWTMIAVKALSQTADRFLLQKTVELRQFYTDLYVNFNRMSKTEMIPHPFGFTYLPMVLKDDPVWKDPDEKKRPKPQSAQVFLSQAIYPGWVFDRNSAIVKGHLQLMKAVMREESPIETGWMNNDGLSPIDAAVFANTLLFTGDTEMARGTFIGFLNHASPLYTWHEEQSLLSAANDRYKGDMPQNRAGAECIRFLRHMLVFEVEKDLWIFPGLSRVDLGMMKPFGITSTPTRWGRVTISMEPAPNKRWITKFKREDFNPKKMPPLTHVLLPRAMPGNVRLDSVKGAHFLKNGLQVEVDPLATSWEALWVDYGK